MSRSRRNTPIFSHCSVRGSEKEDKKLWHRALRKGYSQVLLDEPRLLLLHPKQWGNPWGVMLLGYRISCNGWENNQ